ncbi:MAG: hypothetical protein OEM32_04770 [Acidimicrobiia bacterium]|nr:hypothetical protein [Acidimicrobiia bacterium]
MLASIAIALFFLVFAWQTCPQMGAPPPGIWLVPAGAAVVVGVAIGIWYLMCAFGQDCPCPTRCDWLQIAAMGALGGLVGSVTISFCCPQFAAAALGTATAFAAAAWLWIRNCNPELCTRWEEMLWASAAASVALTPFLFTSIGHCVKYLSTVTATSFVVGVLGLTVACSKDEPRRHPGPFDDQTPQPTEPKPKPDSPPRE